MAVVRRMGNRGLSKGRGRSGKILLSWAQADAAAMGRRCRFRSYAEEELIALNRGEGR